VKSFQELYQGDLTRYPGDRIPRWNRLFHYFLRRLQTCGSRLLKPWYHLCYRIVSEKHCMEISYGASIGKGFCLEDPYTVTVNSNAVIGENVTFGRNVTIGKQNRGEYQGSPVIGDRVTVGDNAVIVGKIKIGNDVRIAANSYVNRDVPAGTTAVGNPARSVEN
jgi:serine O-acetyltransferase